MPGVDRSFRCETAQGPEGEDWLHNCFYFNEISGTLYQLISILTAADCPWVCCPLDSSTSNLSLGLSADMMSHELCEGL